jgi:Ca2+-binding RTX toxin-like protein
VSVRAIVATIVSVATLATAPPVLGATVSTTSGRLDFTADAGETNVVSVTLGGGQIVVTDAGVATITTGGVCSNGTAANVVTCPIDGITRLELDSGDLDDQITNATSLPGQLFGETGHDTLRGGDAGERLDGGPGPDTLDGGGGNDEIYGAAAQEPGAGVDSDTLTGGPGDDVLSGSGGPDSVDGGPGNDRLNGFGGADGLRGQEGADVVIGGSGNDVQDGGPGDDSVGTEVTTGINQTSEETGDDLLLGGSGNDTLAPGPGVPLGDRDTLRGEDGWDAVSYGARIGDLVVSKDGLANDGGAGEGDDVGVDVESVTGGQGNDTLSGGPARDELIGGAGDDAIDGRDGDDRLDGDGVGGAGADTISGGAGDDALDGQAGGDTLSGGPGGDVVEGGTSRDTLSGGPGADRLSGGAQQDTVTYGDEQDVTVRLDRGTSASALPGDDDRLVGVEDVRGGQRRDTVFGTREANVLEGGDGSDYLDGRAGDDRMQGGRAADVVASRDGASGEPVSCGPGPDFAIVDPRDRVLRRGPNRCEQVDDGRDTDPGRGEVWLSPEGCSQPAGDVGLGLPATDRLVPLRYSVMVESGLERRPAPTIDTSDCRLRLRADPGVGPAATAELSGAAAAIRQLGRRVITTVLAIEDPPCPAGSGALKAAGEERRLRVRTGKRRGRWQVRGRFSAAASEGTDWITVETCTSTTTIVHRGRVRVRDFGRGGAVVVSAGRRYVARRTR